MLGLLLAGCEGPTDPICTLGISPAVEVTIEDAATGMPLAGPARGEVRDGAFADSLVPGAHSIEGEMLTRTAAPGRAGWYDVEVTLPGYVTWLRTGVLAPSGSCGVRTTRLHARLEPSPPG